MFQKTLAKEVMIMSKIKEASERLEVLIASELKRIERMKSTDGFTDFKALDKVIIGVLPGG